MNTLVNSKPQLFRTQFHSIQKLPFSQRQRSEHTADCSMFQACFWLHAPLGMFIIFHRIKQQNDELLYELGRHQGLIKKRSMTKLQQRKGRTQCRELPLCAGSEEGCQWQGLPSPVQCEETVTRTQNLPVTGGKTLPFAPGPPFTKLQQRMMQK